MEWLWMTMRVVRRRGMVEPVLVALVRLWHTGATQRKRGEGAAPAYVNKMSEPQKFRILDELID